jgi:hypothetical protein
MAIISPPAISGDSAGVVIAQTVFYFFDDWLHHRKISMATIG